LAESSLQKGSLIIEEKVSEFKKGDLVKHKIFGMGRVEKVIKANKDFKLNINFGGSRKDILASFVQRI
jgi:DNA helicase-2/ATP-dependent DNA helicase PcrA